MSNVVFYSCARQFSSSSIRNSAVIKPPVAVFGVAGRYATALYSAAMKEKKLDSVEKEIMILEGLLVTDKKFAEFVVNPLTKCSTKKDSIAKALAKKNFGPLTINLLAAMAENGRLKRLTSVIDCFKGIMSNIRGEVVCKIISAKPLDQQTLKEFEDTLKGFAKKNEKILLQTEVDPSLLGGVIVTIDDKYIDMSVSAKIKTYNNLLREAF